MVPLVSMQLPDMTPAEKAEAEAMMEGLVEGIMYVAKEFLDKYPDTTDAVRNFGTELFESDNCMGMLEDKMLIAGLGIHIYMIRNMPKEP